ncbi:MAG: bifunctional diaminohydroxyphosphoribosylaminopyrimidine deaminase/5-amino-6-(5-phosphoribosylamino)uracil reductase RibD [Bdellovibrionales bacterium]|nr:bifunctional diaminohydroxyphosphoribosylaminopyrimidine deaminase/5-amino-6-(5-phosphoribosylamino)uracil reductase RibD [Bdellovibrionales bacterium]
MKPQLRKGFGIGGRIARTLEPQPAPSFPFGTDEYWMEQALLQSMESIGLSQPNPAVGCVLIQNQQVIGRGSTQAWRKEHAERVAFSHLDPAADLRDSVAYVTLEPCSHEGFQPPCVELFLKSPIPKIMIAVPDPDLRVNGEGIRRLRAAGKVVEVGILGSESRAWNLNFFINKKTGRPIWAAKWAQTPSGHLCDAEGNSKWISRPESRAHTHWLRQKYDAIVVGARTFLLDQPRLTVRDCAGPIHRNPERFVFDPKGRTLHLPAEKREGFRTLVCEPEIRAAGNVPVPGVISVPVAVDSPDLWLVFRQVLEASEFPRPLQSIMVEGGGRLLSELFKHDLFTVVHRFVGSRNFQDALEADRVNWLPGGDWSLQTQEEFHGDLLHEWIKEV